MVIDSIKSRAFPDLKAYRGILGKIRELGYNSRSLVAFGYDWRESNSVSADKLAGFMRTQIENGTERFIIVAHSMGGLVTRLTLRDKDLAKRVERYVQIATPVQGSSKAYATLKRRLEIHPLFDQYRSILNHLRPETLHHLLESLSSCSSLFELLPPTGTRFLERPVGLWCDALAENVWPPQFDGKIELAKALHGFFQAVPECPHTTIFSTGITSTPYGFSVDDSFNIISNHPGTNGDGTVTWASATFGSDLGSQLETDQPIRHDQHPNAAGVLAMMVERGWLQTAVGHRMSTARLPLENASIVADCKPKVVAVGEVVEINADLTGPADISSLRFRILDEDGHAQYQRELPPVGASRTAYHASIAIPQQIGPGHYGIAVSFAGERGAAVVPFIITDKQAEVRANLLREAFELSSGSREKLECGQIEEATKPLERAVELYMKAGADAPAWQSLARLSDLYLGQNDLESAKQVTLRALKLLDRLDYPSQARQRCNDQLEKIEKRRDELAPPSRQFYTP
jgi:hypothetical protein